MGDPPIRLRAFAFYGLGSRLLKGPLGLYLPELEEPMYLHKKGFVHLIRDFLRVQLTLGRV